MNMGWTQWFKRQWSNFNSLVNNMKIQKKLLIIYIIAGLIPMLFVIFYLTQATRNVLETRAQDEAVNSTLRIEERLKEIFRISITISDALYLDKKLNKIITTHYEEQFDMISDYMEYQDIDNYLRLYSEIDSIRVYVDKPTILDSSQIIRVTDDVRQASWYQTAINDKGRIRFIYKFDEINRRDNLCLIRLIKNEVGVVLGVLVINMSNPYADNIIVDEPFETYATVDENQIFLTNNKALAGSRFTSDNPLYNVHTKDNAIIKTKYNGKNSLMIVNDFSPEKTNTQFKIITIIPTESIGREANKQFRLSLGITFISIIISMALIFMFTRMLAKRIIFFRREMDKVVKGDFEIEKDIESDDEIGSLYKDLQIMIESIRQLIHENYESKIVQEQMNNRQREVEFKMLASQINPHFLYNTLETIRMKAYLSGDKELADIVKKVAKIMRRNLEVSNQLVTLESEVELVKNYLEIQKFRFGDKVSFDINVTCDIKGYHIVPLLLQPLVENAFIHGLENKETKGLITILIQEAQQNLLISVKDDGCGIPKDKLHEIQDILNNYKLGRKRGIGLSNVNQRIKLFYGEAYYLTIDSSEGIGTEFRLYLPLKKELT